MKDWFMNIDEVQLITFSPTCTSKQVGEAIVHGTGISSVSKVDLTLEAAGKREVPSHALADRKSTRLNSSHIEESRMPSSA